MASACSSPKPPTVSQWPSLRYYIISFILSLGLVRRHEYHTVLVTDDKGADLLISSIGLLFDEVTTQLNSLDSTDPTFWNSGKVLAYKLQMEPFVHLDNDVFLWAPLPSRLLQAPMIAQNPEFINEHRDYYRPFELENAVARVKNAQLPDEWRWCRALLHEHQRSYNTGIYGGRDLGFIRHCAELYSGIAYHPRINDIKQHLSNPSQHAGMLEMLLPGMCIDYHRGRQGSPFSHIDAATLFTDPEEACIAGEKIGYTHLLGASKKNPDLLGRLVARVSRDYPQQYKRCEEYCRRAASHRMEIL
jgi:uncharacterized protein DUF6734